MPDAATLARLSDAVNAGFDSEVAFLAELVRFPSLRGREAPLQDWFARQMAARGFDFVTLGNDARMLTAELAARVGAFRA